MREGRGGGKKHLQLEELVHVRLTLLHLDDVAFFHHGCGRREGESSEEGEEGECCGCCVHDDCMNTVTSYFLPSFFSSMEPSNYSKEFLLQQRLVR